MKLYFVHPGENDGEGLSSKGQWEIKMLARRLMLNGFKVDYVYTNGHLFSTQTGKILSRSLNIPFVSDERFSEISKEAIDGNFTQRDCENIEYVNLFVDEILKDGKDALITIADGIHRAIISRLTGMPISATKHFLFRQGSISLLTYQTSGDTGNWRMAYLNDTSHLRLP